MTTEQDLKTAQTLIDSYATAGMNKDVSAMKKIFYNGNETLVAINNLVHKTINEKIPTYAVVPAPMRVQGYTNIIQGFEALFQGIISTYPLKKEIIVNVHGKELVGYLRFSYGMISYNQQKGKDVSILDSLDTYAFKKDENGEMHIEKVETIEQLVILGEESAQKILKSNDEDRKKEYAKWYEELKKSVLFQIDETFTRLIK